MSSAPRTPALAALLEAALGELRAVVRAEVRDAVRELVPAGGDQWLTTAQAAELAQVDADTVLGWIEKGELEAGWAGAKRRIRRRALDAYMMRPRANVVDIDARARKLLGPG